MRFFWIVLGGLALLLGLLGTILPVLPTTPFVILAAFCFGKSSPRLHKWLVELPFFGPMIEDWETYGSIPLRAKWLATGMMLAFLAFSIYAGAPRAVLIAQAIGITIGIGYVVSRPSSKRTPHQNKDI